MKSEEEMEKKIQKERSLSPSNGVLIEHLPSISRSLSLSLSLSRDEKEDLLFNFAVFMKRDQESKGS
jgi:hypothetical protein